MSAVDEEEFLYDTALHDAALKNDVPLMKKLLSQKTDNINKLDHVYEFTPLHHVASENKNDSHFEAAELLLKHGADANVEDGEGLTPFWHLVKNGNAKIVKLFCDFKANIFVEGYDSRNLLFSAAAQNDNLEVLQLLIDLGLDVNFCDCSGQTVLHKIVKDGVSIHILKIVDILIKNGADINARKDGGVTPLWYVIQESSLEMIQSFLNYKPDINVKTDDGSNLLEPAVRRNKSIEVVQLLMDLGLNADQRNKHGETPLHSACDFEYDDVDLMKFLLKNGADINVIDLKGASPMMDALHRRESDEIKRNKAMARKNLNFFIKHSHFNKVSYFNILSLDYQVHEDFLWKMILKHLAKLQILNIPVHQLLLDKISKDVMYHSFYKRCQEELSRAKKTKLKNSWIVFFNLLVESRKKLKNYAGNEDLVSGFKKAVCVSEFPIYGASAFKNLKKGIKRRELFDKSAILLSGCLPIFNSKHLIITDVLDCVLGTKDLKRFCK